MEERRHSDVLRTQLVLPGRRALDVWCGDGALVRFLAREGARPIGMERSRAPLDAALRHRPIGDERYLCGVPQALPFADLSFNLVLFSGSLHRLPQADMAPALAEARRVLVTGGHVYILEPLAEGEYFELVRAVEDSRAARAAAYDAIRAARAHGLHAVADIYYDSPVDVADLEALKQRLRAAWPGLSERLDAVGGELAENFTRLGSPRNGHLSFRQPFRVNVLQRL